MENIHNLRISKHFYCDEREIDGKEYRTLYSYLINLKVKTEDIQSARKTITEKINKQIKFGTVISKDNFYVDNEETLNFLRAKLNNDNFEIIDHEFDYAVREEQVNTHPTSFEGFWELVSNTQIKDLTTNQIKNSTSNKTGNVLKIEGKAYGRRWENGPFEFGNTYEYKLNANIESNLNQEDTEWAVRRVVNAGAFLYGEKFFTEQNIINKFIKYAEELNSVKINTLNFDYVKAIHERVDVKSFDENIIVNNKNGSKRQAPTSNPVDMPKPIVNDRNTGR